MEKCSRNSRSQQQQSESDHNSSSSTPTINCSSDSEKKSCDTMADVDEVVENESNKSTPYFTPMDFVHTTFEFPPPPTAKPSLGVVECVNQAAAGGEPFRTPSSITEEHTYAAAVTAAAVATASETTPHRAPSAARLQATGATKSGQFANNLSPTIGNKKIRRFSLYERRSCSPQHLLMKSTSPSIDVSLVVENSANSMYVDNKENTKPAPLKDDTSVVIVGSGVNFNSGSGGGGGDNNSPIALIDEIGSSPRILGAANEATSRLVYSPKLLTSINNLNITGGSGGSPLGVISSAGYKNGSYFKFPEIDHHIVQEQTQLATSQEPQRPIEELKKNYSNCPPIIPSSGAALAASEGGIGQCPNEENDRKSSKMPTPHASIDQRTDIRKNRKNKNNLTIRITNEVPPPSGSAIGQQQFSPSPKPKTPTIKSTKEKALSLDSAATGESLSALAVSVANRCMESHASCNELGISNVALSIAQQSLHHRNVNAHQDRLQPALLSLHSNSLSLLSVCSPEKLSKSANNLSRSARRRVGGGGGGGSNSLLYSKKIASTEENADSDLAINEDDEIPADQRVGGTGVGGYNEFEPSLSAKHIQSGLTLLTPHRGIHKPNPLLHASNTNLKTLPEFLTLVEFTTTSPKEGHHDGGFPLKQKSMEIPNSACSMATTPLLRTKNVVPSNSSTNLLQRRGSNHSLTLNLHGSCSNLFGNCRSGLSVSNYSLGSAANSTTNLNYKSTCNLDHSNLTAGQMCAHGEANSSGGTASNQGAKQSLFRRRGSNHSLTLSTTFTATSCMNLNSFPSQNSLNISQYGSAGGGGVGCSSARRGSGVTRTTSFITSTNNTSSHAPPTKMGLLERRGSNQSLTLNMGNSIINTNIPTTTTTSTAVLENPIPTITSYTIGDAASLGTTAAKSFDAAALSEQCIDAATKKTPSATNSCCSHYQRKFFSSESLNKEVSAATEKDVSSQTNIGFRSQDFQDSNAVCTCACSGVRNIVTRPLSPQTTSEEFKIYLANIQMLQNASNALSQEDLIKLNFIFDNSYASNGGGSAAADQAIPMISGNGCGASNANNGGNRSVKPGVVNNSEDCEVSARYQVAVQSVLDAMLDGLSDDEQKRMFRDLHKEFWDLPLNHQEKPMVFGSQAKNRYKTILPNENSRVLLESETQQLLEVYAQEKHEREFSELVSRTSAAHAHDEVPYINANYIKGPDYTSKCYIATQGPLPNTVYEFWLLVYQNNWHHFRKTKDALNSPSGMKLAGAGGSGGGGAAPLSQYCQKIVMLTNFLENNRQKCSVYFPVELHEVFVAAGKQAIVTPTDEFLNFFEPYLQQPYTAAATISPSNSTVDMANTDIEELKAETTAELCVHLPALTTNFFIIKNVGIVRKNGFSIRKFVLLYCAQVQSETAGNRRLLMHRMCCYHYWYPDWPDHRSPRDINTLVDISLHILNLGKCEYEFATYNDQLPIETQQRRHIDAQHIDLYQQDIFNIVQPLPIIHCSAGIGRTGCLTAILNGVRQLRQSLAYSLTSMAAAATKDDVTNSQSLSAVDFSLPKQFLNDITNQTKKKTCHGDDDDCGDNGDDDDDENNITFTVTHFNDTDSSYTRNTLLYIKYIIFKQNNKTKKKNVSMSTMLSSTQQQESLIDQSYLPTLMQLPKMPDVFVDILGIVCNLRLQRGGMVQNSEQYELIHRTICLYLKRTFALKRF